MELALPRLTKLVTVYEFLLMKVSFFYVKMLNYFREASISIHKKVPLEMHLNFLN